MKQCFLIFLMILSMGCYQVERNCSNFKTGIFKSSTTIENKEYLSVFTRNDSIQIETFDGKTDTSNVRWINDCEIIFKTMNPKNMSEQKDIHLKIIKTTDSSYTFEYSFVGETIKQKGIAIKLN